VYLQIYLPSYFVQVWSNWLITQLSLGGVEELSVLQPEPVIAEGAELATGLALGDGAGDVAVVAAVARVFRCMDLETSTC
jgi:energy-converting hydrogenase Eha subunit A